MRGGDTCIVPQELLLVKLLQIIVAVLPTVTLPKRPGRPFVYPVQVMLCCFVVMVAKKLSKRGLYKFLTRKDDAQALAVQVTIPFPDGTVPNRRTFDRRLANWVLSAQLYLLAGAALLQKHTRLGIARLAVDNRMFPAFGNIWHHKDQVRGVIPKGLRNIDTTAGWGFSHYRRWIFGHGLDVFVTTGKLVVPILAIARSLTIRGNTAVKAIAPLLPKVAKGVVAADSEYEDPVLQLMMGATGRSFHVAHKRRIRDSPTSKTYRKRKVTVEPFFERFLQALLVRGKLPCKGAQAWGWLMTAIFVYQLAVIYQVLQKEPYPMRVTHLIHTL